MTFENRLSAFVKLGVFLNEQLCSKNVEFADVLARANQENAWFTDENIRFALHGVVDDLDEKNLNNWMSHYADILCRGVSHTPMTNDCEKGRMQYAPTLPKTIAIIMAGNIPLVGFRDFLAVLISGHKILCKLSSKDKILLPYLAKKLIEIEPKFAEQICFEDNIIKSFDAVIATGGHHAVEHFYQYFQNYPHIIRGHRNSCAILDGTENADELRGLFDDMFLYFGLGCRNVTKLFVPENYNFQPLLIGAQHVVPLRETLQHHHLYQSNLQYQQVVSALNTQKIIDANVFLLIENSSFSPPISVIYYEYYSDLADVRNNLEKQKNKIQCVVSHADVPFGHAQKPTLFDYADGIDTMRFLEKLNI